MKNPTPLTLHGWLIFALAVIIIVFAYLVVNGQETPTTEESITWEASQEAVDARSDKAFREFNVLPPEPPQDRTFEDIKLEHAEKRTREVLTEPPDETVRKRMHPDFVRFKEAQKSHIEPVDEMPTVTRRRPSVVRSEVQPPEKINKLRATFAWDEPSTYTNGDTISTLKSTRLYRLKEGASDPEVDEVTATSPQGGGVISYEVNFGVPEGTEAVIDAWATAVDTNGGESDESNHVIVHVDRLAPSKPE